ncbi:MAG: hypothetical protein JNM59_12800 [Hyphomonadaceae bacterium]|nr:hypothetical protein [Hyphomonadaceae bacterium]
MRNALVGLAAFLSIAGASTAASAAPDLVPIASRLTHGVVSVRNVGDAASTPSVVTLNCSKPPATGGCAEIPAMYMPAYTNPAFPDRVSINVPALTPGRVFNHRLRFWDALAWSSGTYHLTVTADAGAAVAEGNEANNAGTHVKVVP